MRKFGLAAMILALSVLGACTHGYRTNLAQVAQETGMRNITTGDGTFENYVATGQYDAYEWGFSFGIPVIAKLWDIYPARPNEYLVTKIANMAKEDGAKAMINVYPHYDFYTGIPCGIVGIYWDHAWGTGIAAK